MAGSWKLETEAVRRANDLQLLSAGSGCAELLTGYFERAFVTKSRGSSVPQFCGGGVAGAWRPLAADLQAEPEATF
ncbi:hypothetical protein PG997_004134 [Apiospora hydei]|uniref:Uncharacterized protein n=1 Tax=Apiospora hydei TaxID=1337664 RepID=A0ABR1X166_9PEZI